MLDDQKTRIGTLRVRASADAAGTRRAAANLLGTAELRPAGMAPSAILVVRRVVDPLPRRVAAPGGVRVSPAWEAAARDALSAAYRRAARPGRELVPASAEAVLFADDAELVACLALDISRGQVGACWWWRTLPRAWTAFRPEALRALFCDRPSAVPAALHHLARRGQAWAVLGFLTPPQAATVLGAVTWAFGLPPLPPPAALLPGAGASPAQAPVADAPEDHAPDRAGDAAVTGPPWEEWLPAASVPRSLSKEHVGLLGVALGLVSAPHRVRGSAFTRAARAWWRAAPARPAHPTGQRSAPSDRASLLAESPPARPAPPPTGSSEASGIVDLAAPTVVDSGADQAVEHLTITTEPSESLAAGESGGPVAAEAATTLETANLASADNPEARRGAEVLSVSPARGENSSGATVARAGGESAVREAVTAPESPGMDEDAPSGPRRPDFAGGVETALGGVLFLINVMADLSMPECFDLGAPGEVPIGPWALLDLLGRALVGPSAGARTDDPLWDVLAELDGRPPGTPPGAGLAPAADFRLPATRRARIAGRAEERYYWDARSGRISLWSARGFLVARLAANGTPPRARARDLLRSLGIADAALRRWPGPAGRAPFARIAGPLVDPLDPSAVRWLAMLLPFIRICLRDALGIGLAEPLDLDQDLFRRPARLYVSPTHLDLVMRLDDVSVPVRLAGLDLDPGWLADFGRVVRFHYE